MFEKSHFACAICVLMAVMCMDSFVDSSAI